MSTRRGVGPSVSAGSSGPVMYRCSLGGEFKPIGAFSDFQKAKVGFGVKKIDPNLSRMVCREHASRPDTAYKCEGPCNKVLPLACFSKNTRREGVYVCNECREWIDSEPDPSHVARQAAIEAEEEEWATGEPSVIMSQTKTLAKSLAGRRLNDNYTCDVSDVASTQGTSMYGFLDHLLEDEDEDDGIASMSGLSNTTGTHSTAAERQQSKSVATTAPLVELSSAASEKAKNRGNKVSRPRGAEMSSVASNSWYEGQGRNGGDGPVLKKDHGTAAATAGRRLAPHEMSLYESSNSEAGVAEKTPLRKLAPHEMNSYTSSAANGSDKQSSGGVENIPPHLRTSDAFGRSVTETKLASQEKESDKGAAVAFDMDADSDTDSDQIISMVQPERKPVINDIKRSSENYYVIRHELCRPIRKIHLDQQQWLKAQPVGVFDEDSDQDSN